jgi:hypothetical protein
MSLVSLVDNTRTDKNTTHSYLELYDTLLEKKKDTATTVLEIGIGLVDHICGDGGSIKLWNDYFPNATVHAVDIRHINDVWEGIKNNERIILHTSTDAYSTSFIQSLDTTFDFVIDDGPHTLSSMKDCVRLYLPLLKEDGILIIEDVQDFSWFDVLRNEVPDHLKKNVETYDLRKNKGRYDDLVFVVNKSV